MSSIKNRRCIIVYYDEFSKRLTQLRQEKGVTARDMSLSLGQSESYINKIENNYAMPSMNGFFYICEYLDITPKDFFDYGEDNPILINTLIKSCKKLSKEQTEALLKFIETL